MTDSVRAAIIDAFQDIFTERDPGSLAPALQDESVLLESGLDSLGFAILVVRLEETLGFDPFLSSQEAYYPCTFGEFVSFYEANKPS